MITRTSTQFAFKILNQSKRQLAQRLPVRHLSTEANSLINVEVNDKTGIALISMNRKPVNGLSLELLEELSNTLDDLEKNKTRGAILTSVRCLNDAIMSSYVLLYFYLLLDRGY